MSRPLFVGFFVAECRAGFHGRVQSTLTLERAVALLDAAKIRYMTCTLDAYGHILAALETTQTDPRRLAERLYACPVMRVKAVTWVYDPNTHEEQLWITV